MQNLKEYMVNESSEFSSMENNPLIYTLVIPKVLNGEIDVIKKDEIIKNVISVTEKFIKDILHCRQILYPLGHQGSLVYCTATDNWSNHCLHI